MIYIVFFITVLINFILITIEYKRHLFSNTFSFLNLSSILFLSLLLLFILAKRLDARRKIGSTEYFREVLIFLVLSIFAFSLSYSFVVLKVRFF
jgi:hypothetical protein